MHSLIKVLRLVVVGTAAGCHGKDAGQALRMVPADLLHHMMRTA